MHVAATTSVAVEQEEEGLVMFDEKKKIDEIASKMKK